MNVAQLVIALEFTIAALSASRLAPATPIKKVDYVFFVRFLDHLEFLLSVG